MKCLFGLARAAALALVLAATALAQNQPAELKLSTALAPAFPLGKAGERWAHFLNEGAAGAFVVRQYPGATLAGRDAGREFLALRDGAADLAVGSAFAWSTQMPVLGAYVLPWLAAEPREQTALAADPALREIVQRALADAGVVVVAIAPLGDRVLATTRGAVQAPAEIAGKRLRVMPYPMVIDTFGALGVRGEAMPFAEAQAALAAGTLDGQEALATTLVATRIGATAQKFVTRWGAFADVMIFAVRRQVWDGWSATQRASVRAAADAAAAEAQAPAREEAALGELTKHGVTIVRLAPTQRAAFRAAVDGVWKKWTPGIGAEAVTAAKAAVAAAPK
jgi:TRAP-type C4-dicarboxylate transport system substrate-binding protein